MKQSKFSIFMFLSICLMRASCSKNDSSSNSSTTSGSYRGTGSFSKGVGTITTSNFTDVFDNSTNDASFIWSTNLLLDNLVLLRKAIK